ncbi:MAG TPA: hypothetical protein VLB44_27825, partial [Kofleriaceae bacterium]|nr:hypothetical protein [Kofleriaceae bacterium]
MRTTLLLLSLSLVLSTTAGCKKQQVEGTANAAPAPAAPAARHHAAETAAAEAPTAGGPVKTTPKDLFADFTKPDVDGLALLDKYRDGATFSGMIKSAGAEESGRPVLMMD